MKSNRFKEISNPIFNKRMSLAVKGIAILMMLAHHCFAFPEYWLDGFSVGTIPSIVCSNFKICVAVFAFITGYGFFVGKEKTYKDILDKVLKFLLQYWLQLFLIFLPVATIHFTFSPKRIFYNLIALYDLIILFAWYVFFHCFVLLTFPLLKRLLTKGPGFNLAIVLLGGYCVTAVLYFLPFKTPLTRMLLDCSIFYPVVGVGFLCARYGVLDRLTQRVRLWGAIAIIAGIFLLRAKVSVIKGFSFDTFYAPMLIMSLCIILEKCRPIHTVLVFLGKHSFHMWLFHSIFFSAYTRDVVQRLITWTSVPVIRFLLITCSSLGVAVLLDWLWGVCSKQLRKITVK